MSELSATKMTSARIGSVEIGVVEDESSTNRCFNEVDSSEKYC